VTVLTLTTRLPHETTFSTVRFSDRLAVGNAGTACDCIDVVFAAHPLDQHFEVQFTHTVDQRLTKLVVHLHQEGRIFLGQFTQRFAHLILIRARLRFNGDADDRVGEADLFQDNRILRVGERLAREGFLQSQDCGDVTRVYFFNVFALVREHTHHTPDTLG